MKSSGPGCRPYCWNAASRIAAVAEVGSPSVSSGTSVPGGGRVVRGLRTGDAFDRAAPERLRDRGPAGARRHTRGTSESRRHRPAARPIGKPSSAPRSHGRHERDQSARDIQIDPRSGIESVVDIDARRRVERLADGEQPDGDDDHVDAVEELREAEGEPRLAGQRIDADQPQREPEEQADQPAAAIESPSTAVTATNARTVSAKYSAGPKRSATSPSPAPRT